MSAGILLVGPDPPIPNKIFTLLFEIESLCAANFIELSLISICGLLSTSKLILFNNFWAASITCCPFFSNSGYWYMLLMPAILQISLYLNDELNIKTLSNCFSFISFLSLKKPTFIAL